MRYRFCFALLMVPMILMGQTGAPSPMPTVAMGTVLRITPRTGRAVAGRLIYQAKDTLIINQLGIAGLRGVPVSNIRGLEIGERSIGLGLLTTVVTSGAFGVFSGASKDPQARQSATIVTSATLVLNTAVWPLYRWRPVTR